MPKKTAKSKQTSTTKKTRAAKKPVSKAPVSESTATTADYKDLFYGTMSAIAVYVFALWAIDSGSLWVYALTFASVYYTIHFYRLFLRNKFFNKQ
jgi:hypothetical protein